jgi:LPS export ABC transporter protein LptC
VINSNFIKLLEGWHFCQPSFLLPTSIGMANRLLPLFTIFIFTLASCDKPETGKPQIYEGPIREAENMEMLYSEKEHVTVKITAKRISEFQSGDRNFPEGVFIQFFGENGAITSTLSANTAYYFKTENKWKGQGKVEVKNMEKEEQLNTEELFWFPSTKKINTDKFVTIRNGREVIYGTGLDAKQDMSEYKILKPEGDFAVEE